MTLQHVDKARHVRALLVGAKGDEHVDRSDGRLRATNARNHHRMRQRLDPDAVDDDIAAIRPRLDIGQEQAVGGVHVRDLNERNVNCGRQRAPSNCSIWLVTRFSSGGVSLLKLATTLPSRSIRYL